MLFRCRIPRPPLDAFIGSIWLYEEEIPRAHALERVLPTGCAQLIVNLKEDRVRRYEPEANYRCDSTAGAVLVGAQTRHSVIDTSEQEYVLGVLFKPGGARPFLRVPVHETADSDVPLDEVWDQNIARTLRERLLDAPGVEAKFDIMEQSLLDVWTRTGLHSGVDYALRVFGQRPIAASVAAVTDAVGLSPKRFIDRFKVEVGMTPKRFCRVLRFQRAVTSAHAGRRVDWAQLALDCGFSDQAHLIHEFRAFSGVTPTAYQAARTEFQNHVKFLQDDDLRA
jgi:AraC-like DNA-binding protein